MTYDEALSYIASLAPRGWRLGLDRMQAFVDKIGLQDSLGAPGGPQYIHVAGTNGKGSVTAYLQSIFVEAGFRTGTFFSPFVYDPRERVQFGKDLISKGELAALTEELIPIADSFSETEFGGITEFEFKAALGFLYWKRKRCDYVALEVGLGGRLDATNVVTPKASIIVSIGLDHTNILGNTLAEIAYEKAGIIKPNVPVIVGKMPEEAFRVIKQEAKEKNAPLWHYGEQITWERKESAGQIIRTPARTHSGAEGRIGGIHSQHNLALAVAAFDAAAVKVSDDAFTLGSERAYAPGRYEVLHYRERMFILDGAHNQDAAKGLAFMLRMERELGRRPRLVLVTNMVAGHDVEKFYQEIAQYFDSAHVVPIDFHRAAPVPETARIVESLIPCVHSHDKLMEGVDAAICETTPQDMIVVTGSFYLVGEVGRILNGADRDF